MALTLTTMMNLHDMWYVVVKETDKPPVAYPAEQWDKAANKPISDSVEQCDCIETAVDFYRLEREVLYSEGKPVLSERDVHILNSLIDIYEHKPRKPRHT